MNTQVFGGLLGPLAGGAAAFSPDEAEAAPRPKYMEELVAKLKSRDLKYIQQQKQLRERILL